MDSSLWDTHFSSFLWGSWSFLCQSPSFWYDNLCKVQILDRLYSFSFGLIQSILGFPSLLASPLPEHGVCAPHDPLPVYQNLIGHISAEVTLYNTHYSSGQLLKLYRVLNLYIYHNFYPIKNRGYIKVEWANIMYTITSNEPLDLCLQNTFINPC